MAVYLEDGFETGDFNDGVYGAWTVTGDVNPIVETAHPYSGLYNAKFASPVSGNTSYLEHAIGSRAIAYARGYFKFDALPTANTRCYLMGIEDLVTNDNAVNARLYNNAGTQLVQMGVSIGGISTFYDATLTPQINTWYFIEILRDITNDIEKLWINGSLECNAVEAIATNSEYIFAGLRLSNTVDPINMYFDDFRVADAYNGAIDIMAGVITGYATLM